MSRTVLAAWSLAIALVLLVARAPAAPKENAAAIDFLTKRGLVRSNFTWLSPSEAKLKGYLDGLKDLENNLKTAEATIAQGLGQNEALKAEIASLEMQLKAINDALQTGKVPQNKVQAVQAQGQQIADRINKLRPMIIDPSGLDENAAVKQAIIRLIEARNAALLAVLYIRENAEGVADSYKELAEDKDVTDAMTALGGKHKLGPAKKYDRDIKRIEKLEKQVMTDSSPVYRDNTMFRVSAIVNDQAATAFTYIEQANVTYIPTSVAEAAGIEIPEDAPKVALQAEGDRKVEARVIKLAKLRFGKHVIENAEVLVLAPENEDLGAMLSPKSLAGFKPNLDVAKLEFILTPLTGDSPGAAEEKKPAKKEPGGDKDK